MISHPFEVINQNNSSNLFPILKERVTNVEFFLPPVGIST